MPAKAAKAQAVKEVSPTPVAQPRPNTEVSSGDAPAVECSTQDGPTVGPRSRRSVMVDFFDTYAPGKFAGNALWISLVKRQLHNLVVGSSRGKGHVTGVQYDKRFPQERRVTLSYEGAKAVAIGVLNVQVWRARAWRKG